MIAITCSEYYEDDNPSKIDVQLWVKHKVEFLHQSISKSSSQWKGERDKWRSTEVIRKLGRVLRYAASWKKLSAQMFSQRPRWAQIEELEVSWW